MSWLIRLSFLSLLPVGAIAVAAADADAQTLPGGATLSFTVGNEFLVKEKEDSTDFTAPDAEERRRRLNYASCICSQANTGRFDSVYAFEVDISADNNRGTEGQVWVGKSGIDCRTVENQQASLKVCADTGQRIPNLDDLATRQEQWTVPIHKQISIAETACPKLEGDVTLWVLAPQEGSGSNTLDYGISTNHKVDTLPPPGPATVDASAVEGQISLRVTPVAGNSDDIAYYQALCYHDKKPLTGRSAIASRFVTPASVCGSTTGGLDPAEVSITSELGSPIVKGDLPGDLFTNAAYICGEVTGAGAVSISGLDTGAEYGVALVAVDLYGNASAAFLNKTLVPIPATDVWEDLDDPKYGVEGGFCLVNETYGGGSGPANGLRAFRDETLAATALGRWLTTAYYQHVAPLGAHVHGSPGLRVIAAVVLLPVIAFAFAWHLLTLPGLLALLAVVWMWRRRRRQRQHRTLSRLVVASAAAAALVAVPAIASAQSSIAPYWEDELIADEGEEGADPVRWNVGIKVGPYTPGIDAQFQDQTDKDRRPFDEAFRGGMWLPVLEVDYFILNHIGQLGIGGSVGFSGDGANPWKVYDPELDPTPGSNDPPNPTLPGAANRLRENADDMTFRMVPLTLTAVYRATQLHDLYGIPVVPYARGGLAYYIWWMRSPNGELAKLDGCAGPYESTTCKGRGGSFGLVGSVGVALRAESIDKDAALSMRESGIEHAGFYVEGSLGWVDGFGNEKRLALGDVTWFGGFNFEF
jgi:hypothetical protein